MEEKRRMGNTRSLSLLLLLIERAFEDSNVSIQPLLDGTDLFSNCFGSKIKRLSIMQTNQR